MNKRFHVFPQEFINFLLHSLGEWTPTQECKEGRINQFQLRGWKYFYEIGDDTTADDVNFRCTGGDTLNGKSPTGWGDWGNWSGICEKGIRGLRTKVEDYKESIDNTVLNNVEFACVA